MTTPATLKQQAAAFEAKRQPEKALAVYAQLIELHGDTEEVDVALRNRVGDLHLRSGDPDRAIALFERSADEYALSGFLNNAIALCNKILRHRAGHVPTLRRLARYCAEKGLVLDAQRHYLAVAEALERQGQHAEALKALGEFADVSPADVHVRTVVVEQLLRAGRREDALPHLTVLYRLHAEAGRGDEAQAVATIAREIDGAWQPDAAGGAAHPTRAAQGLVFLNADSDFEAIAPAAPATDPMLAGLEGLAGPTASPADAGGRLEGFEATSAEEPAFDAAAYAPPVFDVPAFDVAAPASTGYGLTHDAPHHEEPTVPGIDFVDLEPPAYAAPLEAVTDAVALPPADHDDFAAAVPLPSFETEPHDPLPPPALSLDEALALPALGGTGDRFGGSGMGTIPPAPARGSEFVNLADLLGEDEEKDTRMTVGEPVRSGDEDADLQRILREFRAGIEQTIPHEDAETHYDLGIAFREMGLIDDAIAEFQIALRSPTRRLEATEALGGCFVTKGDPAIARTVLLQGIAGQGASDDALRGVLYLLGRAEESLGARDEAVRYYQRVYAVDIRFRDVAARLQTLQQPT
jgi:tetratricopeptide (TPR) repeat protein